MSTYMKYTLPIGLLAVAFWCEEVSKFGIEMRFFIVFDNMAASLHRNLKCGSKRENTLICHTTMHRNTIDFGYNSSYVALWCLEAVPVVYARVFTYAERVHKMMQYACAVDHVVLQGAMKVNMVKLHFNLLQLI